MKDGDWVDLHTVWDDGQNLQGTHGFQASSPTTFPAATWLPTTPRPNPLVPLSSVAENAGTPTSKSIPVVLVPHVAQADQGVAEHP